VRRFLVPLILLGALALPANAGQTGTVTRQADLRSTPFADARTLQVLRQGTSVEVLKRSGGWYQVKVPNADGWIRMWLLRFSSDAGASARDVELIKSGRAGSTYTTATTGVRGLSEEELANAQPDPAAVQFLEQLAVAPADARAFAQQGSLQAAPEALK
jgi:hypothetical protein